MYKRKIIIAIITIVFVYISYKNKDILFLLGSFILGLLLMRIIEIREKVRKRKEEKEILENLKEVNNEIKK